MFGISGATGLLGGVTNVGDGGELGNGDDEGAGELGTGSVTGSDGSDTTGDGGKNDRFSLGGIGSTGK